MNNQRDRSRGPLRAMLRRTIGLALAGGVLSLALGGIAVALAKQPTVTAPLVFDGVTVIDVEHGRRIPLQRVVIVGNRIRTMGSMNTVRVPAGARVIAARGKYLIPGLWDMHTHSVNATDIFYPLFVANGITGIRDASSTVPLDSLIMWRREILAGTRVGPPRQILSGMAIDEARPCKRRKDSSLQGPIPFTVPLHTCVTDAADARHLVDSLKAAGADMIKTYALSRDMYFAIAAEARRIGIPFGGHDTSTTAIEGADSGASILDHIVTAGGLDDVLFLCVRLETANVKQCGQVAEHFRRHGTWWVPTLIAYTYGFDKQSEGGPSWYNLSLASDTILARWNEFAHEFWADSVRLLDLRHGRVGVLKKASEDHTTRADSDSCWVQKGILRMAHCVGMPILAGTDVVATGPFESFIYNTKTMPPGFALHTELAIYVAEGLTPLEALQAATINAAKLLHGTDSLGTVAAGKLADLVLLDADPLADITNTTTIQGVVANGRYFDRGALDQLLADARVKVKQKQ
jgi:hypothetical protein